MKKFLDAYSDVVWKANNGPDAEPTGQASTQSSSTLPSQPQAQAQAQALSASTTPAPPQPPGYEFGKNYPPTPFPYAQAAAYAFFPPGAPSAPLPQKRPYPFEGEGAPEGSEAPSKRSPRHCCKCGSQECKGKGGRSFCTNGCQDCGKMECRGRNSRRPDKKCADGWM